MASTPNNTAALFDDFDTSDIGAPQASTPREMPKPLDPASIALDGFDTDDLVHRDAVDYGNGAYGAPGANTGARPSDGSPPTVSLAGKRDLGEKAGSYAELNKGLGGQYSPMVQGMSFGSFDELSSAGLTPLDVATNYLRGKGPTSLSEAYDQRKAEYLRDRALFEEERPLTALGAEVAGGILSGGAGAKFVANAPGYGSMLLRGAGVGAAETGAYAALDTEGTLLDRLKAGGTGAAIGAGVGVGAPLIGSGVTVLGRGIGASKNAAADGLRRFFNPAAGAEADFVRQAARDRVNFEAASRRAAAGGSATPERDFATFDDALDAASLRQTFDVGDLGGSSARKMARDRLEGDSDAAEFLVRRAESRQSDQGQRASELVEDMFGPVSGVRGGLNPSQTVGELRRRAQAANRQNYREAFEHPSTQDVWRGGIRGITGSDAVKKAFADAAKEHSEDLAAEIARGGSGVAGAMSIGRAPAFRVGADGMLDLDPAGGKVSLRFLDRVQKKLDDQIEAAKGPNGKMTHEATRLAGFRKLLLENMDDASTVDGKSLYGAARGTARAFFETSDAYRAGMKMATGRQGTMDLSAARAAIEGYSEPERALFARGYAATLIDRISKLPDGKDVERLLNNPSARENLKLALGEENAARFEGYLFRDGVARQLGDIAKAAAKRGGDGTIAKRIEQALSAGGGFYIGSLLDGDASDGGSLIGALFGVAGRSAWAKVSGAKRRQYAQALSQLMASSEPNDIARVHAKIMADPNLARLHATAASRGVLGVAKDGAGLLARETPGAAAQVGAAGLMQAPQLARADREARVLAAPPAEAAYARGGIVLNDADRELVERRSRANGSTPEMEARRLIAARSGERGFAEGGLARRLETQSALYQPQMSADLPTYDAAAAEEARMKRILATLSDQLRLNIAERLTPQSLEELMAADAYTPRKLSKEGVRLAPSKGVARLKDGGLVQSDGGSPAGDAYFTGEGLVDQPAEKTLYDAPKGRATKPVRKVGASAGRRDTVSDRSRMRMKPERMLVAPAPMTDALKRQFWGDLRTQLEAHAAARGFELPAEMFPTFDDEPVASVATVEIAAVEPKEVMPPKAPLAEHLREAGRKRRAKRESRNEPHEILP